MNTDLPLESAAALRRPAWPAGVRLPAVPTALGARLAIVAGWGLVTLLVPAVTGREAEQVVYGARLLAPSAEYPFGTDAVGRDVLVRTVVGFRYDFLIALASALAAALAGVLLGALAGSSPEWLDNLVMRVLDVIGAFPSFVLAIALAVALGPSIPTLIVAIALVLLPLHARGTRAAILAERAKPY